jgi:hypothetical protein
MGRLGRSAVGNLTIDPPQRQIALRMLLLRNRNEQAALFGHLSI